MDVCIGHRHVASLFRSQVGVEWVSGGWWSVNLFEKIWNGLKCQLFNVESTEYIK